LSEACLRALRDRVFCRETNFQEANEAAKTVQGVVVGFNNRPIVADMILAAEEEAASLIKASFIADEERRSDALTHTALTAMRCLKLLSSRRWVKDELDNEKLVAQRRIAGIVQGFSARGDVAMKLWSLEFGSSRRVRAWIASTYQRQAVRFIRCPALPVCSESEPCLARQLREREAAERIQGLLQGWIGKSIVRSLLWEEAERRRRLEDLARQGAKVYHALWLARPGPVDRGDRLTDALCCVRVCVCRSR